MLKDTENKLVFTSGDRKGGKGKRDKELRCINYL